MLALRYLLALVTSLTATVSAAGVRGTMALHERRDNIPAGFERVGNAPVGQPITLRLALTQGDMAGLEERLMAVSTPSSKEYGQFLSKEQVRSICTLYFAGKSGSESNT
jgi:tripeptidyl-peptidase I